MLKAAGSGKAAGRVLAMSRALAGSSAAQASSNAQAAAPPKRLAVIGGGIAGLSAATAAAAAAAAASGPGSLPALTVTVLDLGGRGPGGRMSSRQLEQPGLAGALSFDVGAQQITAIGPDFRRELEAWRAAGVVAEWAGVHGRITEDGRFEERPASPPPPGAPGPGSPGHTGFCGSLTGLPLWVGTPTNNAVCAHLADQLRALPGTQLVSGAAVQAAERAGEGCGCAKGGWRLRGSRRGRAAAADPAPADQLEDLGAFDAVVLADAMPLLPGSAGHVAGLDAGASSLAQLARSVRDAAPEPCFALMLAFPQPLAGVPFESAAVEGGGPWAWVANNSSKPGRPGGDGSGGPQCWVALTTPERARELLAAAPLTTADGRFNPQTQRYQADVAGQLLADFRTLMAPWVQGPLPEPAYCHAQRWGRAFVPQPLGSEFLFLPAQRLALCGDVCTGSSVEAAWRSGRAAGTAVAGMLLSPTPAL